VTPLRPRGRIDGFIPETSVFLGYVGNFDVWFDSMDTSVRVDDTTSPRRSEKTTHWYFVRPGEVLKPFGTARTLLTDPPTPLVHPLSNLADMCDVLTFLKEKGYYSDE